MFGIQVSVGVVSRVLFGFLPSGSQGIGYLSSALRNDIEQFKRRERYRPHFARNLR